MKFEYSNELTHNDCLVIGLFSDSSHDKLTPEQQQEITPLMAELKQAGDSLLHYRPQHFDCNKLLLVNCGEHQHFDRKAYDKVITKMSQALAKAKAQSATIALPNSNDESIDWQLHQSVLAISSANYQFNQFKKQQTPTPALSQVSFYANDGTPNDLTITQAECIAQGMNLTRDLGNSPPNVCTPSYLGKLAEQLADDYNAIETTVYGRDQLKEMGANALLAVGQGSDEEPKLIEMNYRGAGDSAPIVLVGKGITFDSGGITLKPGNGMEDMKFDMCGAASVFGTVKAIAAMNLPVNLIGLVASAENMPSGKAVKPSDIVTSLSGQTIEIINTDAEGRLVLCDALTYAEKHKPQWIVDIATLTGAVIVALGNHYTGLFSPDEELTEKLLDASKQSLDKTWRLPMDECYKDALDSPFADTLNATFNRAAGSITAATFLARFTESMRWAHLDIAGTANVGGKNKGATGRPVPLLTQFILNEVNTN